MVSSNDASFCDEHKLQCSNMSEAFRRLSVCESSIGTFMGTRTILTILGLVTTLFMGIFAFSVRMNMLAINGSQQRHDGQQVVIERVIDTQKMIQIDLAGMKGVLHEVQKDVEDVKRDVKEYSNK